MTLSDFSTLLDSKIQSKKHIALIVHRNPDGDAFGSLEGMRWLLESNFTDKKISVVVPPEEFDTHVSWILWETVPTIPTDTDVVIILDTSILSRTALSPENFDGFELLSIDHHEALPLAVEGYRDETAASTTQILTQMARTLNWSVSPTTATALLMGIYTDTGWFIHRNTTADVLQTASYLIENGADQPSIAQKVFGNYTLDYVHNLGHWLLAIKLFGCIAVLCLPEDSEAGLKNHIVSYLSGLANVDIACVIIPDGSELRGSLRTRYDEFDVNEIAKRLWGGGHKKAAWFRIVWELADSVISFENTSYSLADFVTKYLKP